MGRAEEMRLLRYRGHAPRLAETAIGITAGWVPTVDANGDYTHVNPSGFGGAGAPSDAQYLVLAANGSLSAERVFTPGEALIGADADAGAAYTLSFGFAGQANNDVVIRTGGAWTRLAVGDEQVLGRARSAAVAALSPLDLLGVDRKHAIGFPSANYNDLSGGSWRVMTAEGSTNVNWYANTDGAFVGKRTNTTINTYAGYYSPDSIAFSCLPKLRFKIRTGPSVADALFFIGAYDNAGAPDNTGTYTAIHAGVYMTGAGGWVATCSDGTQDTGAIPTLTFGPNMTYLVEVDASNPAQVVVRAQIRGGTWYSATLSSNPPAVDTTRCNPRIRVGTTAGSLAAGVELHCGIMYADWL